MSLFRRNPSMPHDHGDAGLSRLPTPVDPTLPGIGCSIGAGVLLYALFCGRARQLKPAR